jgi:hypothetical protein
MSEGLSNHPKIIKQHLFVSGLTIPSRPLPQGIDYPMEQWVEGSGKLLETFATGMPQ